MTISPKERTLVHFVSAHKGKSIVIASSEENPVEKLLTVVGHNLYSIYEAPPRRTKVYKGDFSGEFLFRYSLEVDVLLQNGTRKLLLDVLKEHELIKY